MKKPDWRELAQAVTSRAAAAKNAAVETAATLADKDAARKAIEAASASARKALQVGRAAVHAGAASAASGAKAAGAAVGAAATNAKKFAEEHPELVEGAFDLALDLVPGGKPASKVARFALGKARDRVSSAKDGDMRRNEAGNELAVAESTGDPAGSEKYPRTVKKCATCAFWTGPRTPSSGGYSNFEASAEGRCSDGGFDNAAMNASATCGEWELWAAIRK